MSKKKVHCGIRIDCPSTYQSNATVRESNQFTLSIQTTGVRIDVDPAGFRLSVRDLRDLDFPAEWWRPSGEPGLESHCANLLPVSTLLRLPVTSVGNPRRAPTTLHLRSSRLLLSRQSESFWPIWKIAGFCAHVDLLGFSFVFTQLPLALDETSEVTFRVVSLFGSVLLTWLLLTFFAGSSEFIVLTNCLKTKF